ncbi:unnamed protein product [Mytilus edulis]|uniref:Uncharacterized protein n=1 Tax=Mytilus edulis TaxID=6550 RepID=A0A8S3UAT1_MYTED|nr:unnamed protein product [Mytilus edulis]
MDRSEKEYQIMTEESEQPLASQRQMSGFNQDTFRRAVIDGIDQQFQMGLKELKTTVDVLKEEMDTLNEKLKGKQEEINNLSKLYRELQLKEKKEIELLDEINKLKTDIKEKYTREVALKKQHETSVARLTKEMDVSKTNLIRERKLLESHDESNADCKSAVLVLIGFPGSGKSETSNTLIGKRDFKAELQNFGPKLHQEVNSVFGDLHVNVRDIQSFESLNEFVDIYNSLIDLECRKVVFGLTIGIGRIPTGYTDTLKVYLKIMELGNILREEHL